MEDGDINKRKVSEREGEMKGCYKKFIQDPDPTGSGVGAETSLKVGSGVGAETTYSGSTTLIRYNSLRIRILHHSPIGLWLLIRPLKGHNFDRT
jgi:hypothetical protein